MNSQKIYDILTTLGFFLLIGGLAISKFAVTIGIITISLTSFLLIFQKGIKFELKELSSFSPLILTYLLLCISVLYSQEKNDGLNELWVQNGLISVPLFVGIHWTHFKRKIFHILHFLFAIAALSSIVTLIFYALPVHEAKELASSYSFFQDYPDLINKTQFGLYSPFIDRLHFAYCLGFCGLLAVYLSFRENRWYYKLLSGLFLLMILILGARGAQLALLFALISYLLYYLKSEHSELKIFSLSSLLFSLMFIIVTSIISYEVVPSVKNRFNQMRWELDVIKDGSYVNHEYQHFTTLTRLKSFEHSKEIIRDNFVLGTGIGDVKNDLREIYKLKSPDIPLHHQNYYMYLWMAGGIITVLSFIFFQFAWIKNFISQSSSILDNALGISYTIFVLIILLVDAPLKYHLGGFGIPLFYLMILAISQKSKPN